MRPSLTVGIGAVAMGMALSGAIATLGVEPTAYRPLEEARFRQVILPPNTRSIAPTVHPGTSANPDPAATGGMLGTHDEIRPDGLDAPALLAELPEPTPAPTARSTPTPEPRTAWRSDPEISWYGPGFYGKRTACGLAMTKTLIGVAHRSLPCGTQVVFRYAGRTLVVPVVDRGPYVAGRQWDLTAGAAIALDHLFTGPIEWRYR